VLGVSRATYYRRRRATAQPAETPSAGRQAARGLSEEEQTCILDVVRQPRFIDRGPRRIVAELLEEGHYYCSASTALGRLTQRAISAAKD
jgi:putative transposase